ncbi:MAG: serine hydroxymethyltransferase [Gemmatimonadota bacterium]
MGKLSHVDPEIAGFIRGENRRQHQKIRLIPSENYTSEAVVEACASPLTNKYSEGYPGRRYYQGQHYIDKVESLCIERACALFGAEHANVQPYSGSPANQAVYLALMKPGDTLVGMNLAHGGHLTHGAPVSISGLHYNALQYGVRQDTGELDYDQIEALVRQHRPRVVFCGASAYPRLIDFERFAAIGHAVDAVVVADIAHIAGLVAAGVHPAPFPHVDVVTTTTHKSLRGPRGGMILCQAKYAKAIDDAVFPGLQGGPHNSVIAGVAVALKEAATDAFRAYAARIVENARSLAAALVEQGFDLFTGGTDNHLLLIDVTNKGLTGNQMAVAMEAAGLICNKNLVPFDPRPPMDPSGIRIGTPAVTSRGFGPAEMVRVAAWMARVARVRADAALDREARKERYREMAAEVRGLCDRFPAPGLSYPVE